jgi:hypothetical protein
LNYFGGDRGVSSTETSDEGEEKPADIEEKTSHDHTDRAVRFESFLNVVLIEL